MVVRGWWILAVLVAERCGAFQVGSPRPALFVARAEAEANPVEEEAPAEDERTVLRRKIDDLDAEVRSKRLELERLRDLTDDSGKNGYYRLAAQAEQFKRTSTGSAAASTERSKVKVFRALLPVLDAIADVDAEGQDKIQSSYQQVYASLNDAMGDLGLVQFDAAVGDAVDASRHDAGDVKEGIIAEQVRPGFLIAATGDVVRPAKVVVVAPPPQASPETEQGDEAPDDDDA